jgi:hypothetical protein
VVDDLQTGCRSEAVDVVVEATGDIEFGTRMCRSTCTVSPIAWWYRPVMMGQLRGFLDQFRNRDTQRELAYRLGQNPAVPLLPALPSLSLAGNAFRGPGGTLPRPEDHAA